MLSEQLECSCGGIAACSTCHVVLDQSSYSKFEDPEESELDMIDLAWGPTPTSRLGCQLVFSEECDDVKMTIPEMSNNLF